MTTTVAALTSHPAKFPNYVLDRIALYVRAEARALGRPARVLDPFAGVGRIHSLPSRIAETTGIEIEPEWAACRSRTLVGDATQLPPEWTGTFDVVATSPCYGNRLADHHEAKDACSACGGAGAEWDENGCDEAPWLCSSCSSIDCACGGFTRELRAHVDSCSTCRSRRCPKCGGNGLSKRYTYRDSLRRMPAERSAAVLEWGGKYRYLHRLAWQEAHRVLRPRGLILVNMKNHVRGDVEQMVTEWHEKVLGEEGFDVAGIDALPAPGIRHGKNHEKRTESEQLIVARRKT